ncbi:MAG: hypothetical protein ACE14S_01995 [Candidatus Bathyarchaeia archaeon]
MRLQLSTATLIVLLASLAATLASATLVVGVKTGDWIEYYVVFTGDSSLGHDVVHARLDVTNVQDTVISLNMSTTSTDGTVSNSQTTLDVATGQLGDDFIIPANLNTGDTFFDRVQGDITIAFTEQRTEAGAERTVVSAATSATTYYWDRATGVLVEASSTYPGYAITSKASATNLWSPRIVGLEPLIVDSILVAVAATIVVAVVAIAVRRKRNKPFQTVSS